MARETITPQGTVTTRHTVTVFEQPASRWRGIFATTPDVGPMIARLALGAAMFPHGAQKALGWFGGPGFQGTIDMMAKAWHIPMPLAVLAIAAEFLGSLGLIVGLLGRVAAFGIAVNMAVAVALVHHNVGFFMNWMGNQRGEGFEYHLLALGLALVVMAKGSGLLSLDRLIARRERAVTTYPD